MGLKDVSPQHQHSDSGSGAGDDDRPHGDQPGAVSTPDADGAGTVGLADRSGAGSPGANQGKTEPMPPAPGSADPDSAPSPARITGPELADMNVGAGDPQAPAHGAARPRDAASASGGADHTRTGAPPGSVPGGEQPGSGHGVPVTSDSPMAGTSEDQPVVTGLRSGAGHPAEPDTPE